MHYNMTILGNRLAPICFLPSGKLVCYKQGEILVYNGNTVEKRFTILRSRKEQVLGKCRYLYRLLRFGVRAAWAIDESHLLLSL